MRSNYVTTDPSLRFCGLQLSSLTLDGMVKPSLTAPSRCLRLFLSISRASVSVDAVTCSNLFHSESVIWTSTGSRVGPVQAGRAWSVEPHRIQPWTRTCLPTLMHILIVGNSSSWYVAPEHWLPSGLLKP